MAGMTDAARLRLAYQHSRLNRHFMASGTACRCFHCLHAFAAEEIKDWADDGETARCPICGVDAVLSSQSDRLSDALIQKLRAAYFDGPAKKYTTEEWRTALAKEHRGRDAMTSGE
jgi:NAD-dependent SIR2 family protein deacetylase